MLQGYYCDDPDTMFPNSNNDPNFNEWVKYEEAKQRIAELERLGIGYLEITDELLKDHLVNVELGYEVSKKRDIFEQALKEKP